MRKFLYALYDREFNTYNDPHSSPLDPKAFVAETCVAFRSAEKDKVTPQVMASEFHHIGYFDTETGEVISCPAEKLIRVRDIFRKMELEAMEENENV